MIIKLCCIVAQLVDTFFVHIPKAIAIGPSVWTQVFVIFIGKQLQPFPIKIFTNDLRTNVCFLIMVPFQRTAAEKVIIVGHRNGAFNPLVTRDCKTKWKKTRWMLYSKIRIMGLQQNLFLLEVSLVQCTLKGMLKKISSGCWCLVQVALQIVTTLHRDCFQSQRLVNKIKYYIT